MRKQTTSSKIALKFSLFNSVIILIIVLFLNGMFFLNWYTSSNTRLSRFSDNNPSMKGNQMMQKHFGGSNRVVSLNSNSPEAKLVLNNIKFLDFVEINEQYFLFNMQGSEIKLIEVTNQVVNQLALIKTSIFLLVVFLVFGYFIGIWFVKSSLNKLNELVDFVNKIDIDNLGKHINMEGPEDDSIKILSDKIDELIKRLQTQTLALKDFVSNAGHELKTPLSVIQTQIDLANKTGDYKSNINKIKSKVQKINSLLDILSAITKLEANDLSTKPIKPFNIIKEALLDIQSKYSDKGLELKKDLDPDVILTANSKMFSIMINNLIENAYKYTGQGFIKIFLNQNKLIIQDTGKGIHVDNQGRIWERFWQADSSRSDVDSFGLGLYLVKKIIDKHNWNIKLESQVDKGSKFTIKFS